VLKRWVVRAREGSLRYRLMLAVEMTRLAADRRNRLKMMVLWLFVPLRERLLGPGEATVRVRLGATELPWTVGPKSDYYVLHELFVRRIYDFDLGDVAPRTILDLGAHVGASVVYFRERFPDARIVALEPDPGTFERLRRNVGALPGVELRREAVATQDGPVSFFPHREGWLSSLNGAGDGVTVTGRTLAGLLAELGSVDLLKLDVEGVERQVLEDAPLDGLGAILGEFHETDDPSDRERFYARLRRDFELDPESDINFAGVARRRG
jgi:FkbM family methyltransferase